MMFQTEGSKAVGEMDRELDRSEILHFCGFDEWLSRPPPLHRESFIVLLRGRIPTTAAAARHLVPHTQTWQYQQNASQCASQYANQCASQDFFPSSKSNRMRVDE